MPLSDGEFTALTEEEIIDKLETELQNEFGNDIDLSPNSVFTTIATVLARVLAEDVETDLKDVYESAFLTSAEGTDLDNVVEIIGLTRQAAVAATGAVIFSSDDPVTSTHTIQAGQSIQTDENTPVEFETNDAELLELFDNFEAGSLDSRWTGDTANASVQNSTVISDNWSLQLDSTDDARILDSDDNLTKVGDTVSCEVQLPSTAIGQVLFGTQDASNTYFVEIDQAGTLDLRKEVAGTESSLQSSTGLTIPAASKLRVEIDWQMNDKDTPTITATLYDASGSTESEIDSVSKTDGEWDSGGVGFGSGGTNANKYFDNYTTIETSASITAVEGGADGNVGANTLTVLPTVPNGVDSVTNPNPTGNDTYRDPDGELYVLGTDEEDDDELRERARDVLGGTGDATHDAIVNYITNNVQGVTSVKINENKTDTDNTGSGGLPPHSFEAVVLGGDDIDVAEAIFEKKAVTARDYGGANGTKVSETVTSDENDQQFTIEFSRPSELSVDFTLDLVVTDTYVGDDEVQDTIVEYVGGTLTDGTDAIGLGLEEDVFIDEVEERVLSLNGVRSITSISTTPSSTTNANSEDIVDVGTSEVAQTDATDGSITLNVTTV